MRTILDNPILDTDSYKLSHYRQYPQNTEGLYAYLEARGGKSERTVFFGLQPILQRLCEPVTEVDLEEAAGFASAHGEPFPFKGWQYIVNELGGRIPLRVRAVREGSVVPTGNVLMTGESTDPKVPWVSTWFETQLMRVWYPITVATKSFEIQRAILKSLRKTADFPEAELPYKLHDFGSRGVSSRESAGIGGAAHLLSSCGTDTIEGALYAKQMYGSTSLVLGYSIPAMEHSSVTAWGQSRETEREAFRNMMKAHPEFKILACVSDSFNIFDAVEKTWCGDLLDEVKASGKTIVIRPDSGDPKYILLKIMDIMAAKLPMETNSKGYKVLPPYFRLIWGDGNKSVGDIQKVLSAFACAGYSTSNIAFGMGGGLLQQVDRDTHSFAYKTSAIKINGEWQDVKKNPVTDAGKRSKAGRLELVSENGQYRTVPEALGAGKSELVTVFENGQLTQRWTFDEVRMRTKASLMEE